MLSFFLSLFIKFEICLQFKYLAKIFFLMTDQEEREELDLLEFIDVNNECINKLEVLKLEIAKSHKQKNAGRTLGTITSTFGTAVMTTSLVIAPLTGGLSITVAGVGSVITLIGAVVGVAIEIFDFYSSKSFVNKIEISFEDRNKVAEKLQVSFGEIEQVKNLLQNKNEIEKTKDSDDSFLYATYLVIKKGVKSKNFSKDRVKKMASVKNVAKSLSNFVVKNGEKFRQGLKMQSDMLASVLRKIGISF
jgi:hypothetical protein